MANFFKEFTSSSKEKFRVSEQETEKILKTANEGSTHDPKTLPKPEKDEE